MVSIPGGSFQMGSEDGEIYEQPVHTVSISPFYMSMTEITQEQYTSVIGSNPSPASFIGDDLPVLSISWYMAAEFCNRMSDLYGYERCYDETTWECDFSKNGYRLPTEAEWEYACRAGTTTEYYTGDTESDLDEAGWYENNSGREPHVVGLKTPNSFGLYDMHGNVWEWCNDFPGAYSQESSTNPTGPDSGDRRVLRGASSWNDYLMARSAWRNNEPPDRDNWDLGIRIVRREGNTILGRVLHNGSGLADVSVNITGESVDETVETDGNGYFTLSITLDGTYTITPKKLGYTFTPESSFASVSGEDVTVNDIVASPVEGYEVINGMTFASVPGGYVEGEYVEPFKMGITEVTNQQYVDFLNEALDSDYIEVNNNEVLGKKGLLTKQLFVNLDDTHIYYHEGSTNELTRYSFSNKIQFDGVRFTVDEEFQNWPAIVRWYGAQAYTYFYNYDLPSYEQWEIANKGGMNYRVGTNNGVITSENANFNDNVGHYVDVGSYAPNPYGLYDLAGNASEHVSAVDNRYGGDYHSSDTECEYSYHFKTGDHAGFRIIALEQVPQINFPKGGEEFIAGNTIEIMWKHKKEKINISYSTNNGSSWNTIANNIDGELGIYYWTTPQIDSNECLIKISNSTDTTITSISEISFSINPANDFTINGIPITALPENSFQMGGGSFSPIHSVSLHAFYMGKYEITQKQYSSIIGTNPSSYQTNDDLPVTNISWYSAAQFCNKLSLINGFDPCYNESTWECDFTKNGFRLPTEAEWEYACGAGLYGENSGVTENNCFDYAWYEDNSVGVIHAIGQKKPNAWNLYDMHGNVAEMCNDWYDEQYYEISPEIDPLGADLGDKKVRRGGAFHEYSHQVLSYYRHENPPDWNIYNNGFRIVRREYRTIQGTILDDTGSPVPSAAVFITGAVTDTTVTTDDTGSYELTAFLGGEYVVKPHKVGYTFTPDSNQVSIEWEDATVDFTAEKDGRYVFEQGIPFARIPAGSFEMGSDKIGNTKPVHTVTLSGFLMSNTEVTQDQYESVMGVNPASNVGQNLPVENVSWYEAVQFCNRLSDQYGLDRCYDESTWKCDFSKNGYRLPTEAEWAYAAKGGKQYHYATDDGTIDTNKANVNNTLAGTIAVGSYPANPFGLFDMTGNVVEWCNDWYKYEYYNDSPSRNPTGPDTGTDIIERGGGWPSTTMHSTTTYRYYRKRDYTSNGHGFRIVRSLFTIEGTIAENTGAPVAGVQVLVANAETDTTVTTDADGFYRITGLEKGTYTLTPTKSGYGFSETSHTVAIDERYETVDMEGLPYLVLTSPTGGEFWETGTEQQIAWTSNFLSNIRIEYSTDGGTSWVLIEGKADAAAGSYAWTVPDLESTDCRIRLTDTIDANVTVMSFASFTVTKPVALDLIQPDGGMTLYQNTEYEIRWNAHRVEKIRIDYTPDGGTRWIAIASSVEGADGSYSWTVPAVTSANCMVRLTDLSNANRTAANTEPFSIMPPSSLTVTSPNGGEKWSAGKTYDIRWSSSTIEMLNIEYTVNGGTSWVQAAAAVDATAGSYEWTVPEIPSSNCLVRLTDAADTDVRDSSDGAFTILPKPLITLTSPQAGDEHGILKTVTIRWAATNVTSVIIEFSADNGRSWTAVSERIPAGTGEYSWTTPDVNSSQCLIRVSDADDATTNTKSGAFSIVQEPTVHVVSPDGGETWMAGTTQVITWTSAYVDKVKLEYSSNAGTEWVVIAESVDAGAGMYSWKVPDTPAETFMIRISDVSDAGTFDGSDDVFTVTPPPGITVTAPNGGQTWNAGTNQTIGWTAESITAVKIEYSTDNGATWETIVTSSDAPSGNVSWTGSHAWTVPDLYSTGCLVRVVDVNDGSVSDRSDAPFTIMPTKSVTLTKPNGGEVWEYGGTHDISWDASESVTSVRIEYSSDNGVSWTTVAASVNASDGSYAWTIPDEESGDCLVRVTCTDDANVRDSSDGTFSITHEPFIHVTGPNGGESLTTGSSTDITWDSHRIGNVRIDYSPDNGSSWVLIAASVDAAQGTYSWQLPGKPSASCLVRVTDTSDANMTDLSDESFVMAPAKNITLTSPNGGELWTVGESQAISWQSSGIDALTIELSPDGGSSWIVIASNVPAASGSYSWTVTNDISENGVIRITDAKDANFNDTSDAVFTISMPPYVDLLSPQGSGKYTAGTEIDISWDAHRIGNVRIEFSPDGGTRWTTVAQSIDAADRTFTWTLPGELSNRCRIRITDTTDANRRDESDSDFSIVPPPSITVLKPNGGETLIASSSAVISWEAVNVSHIMLQVSLDNGSTWQSLAERIDVSSQSTFSWTVPATESSTCLVRITDADTPDITDTSDAPFSIQKAAFIQVTSPNGGELWDHGTTHAVTWESYRVSNVRIEYSLNGGGSWTQIAGSVPAENGTYDWTLPASSSQQGLVRITDITDSSLSDTGDAVFEIVPPPSIELTYPHGGEEFIAGRAVDIAWNINRVKTINIEFSSNGGSSWQPVASGINAGLATYQWTVPETVSSTCMIRIIASENDNVTDQCDAAFSILAEPELTVLSPNGGETYLGGSTISISWAARGLTTIDIRYSSDGGTTWNTVAEDIDADTESYEWTVPDMESDQLVIEVADADFDDVSYSDSSDDTFQLFSTEKHNLALTAPGDGDILTVASTVAVTWDAKGTETVTLEYSTDGGASWQTIATDVSASSGSYSWLIPDVSSDMCLVRISDAEYPTLAAVSTGVFEILKPTIVIDHTPIESAPENSALTFRASITSEADIEQVQIHYDTAGERVFDGVRLMELKEDIYEVSLNPGLFTANGMEYYITVLDRTGYTARLPQEGYFSIAAEVTAMKSQMTVQGGTEQNAYRMVSVPLYLSGSSIAEQLTGILPSGNQGSDWRLFRWSPIGDRYYEYPEISEALAPGRAYWLIIKSGEFNLKGLKGTTVPTDEPFEISLAPGWNDIANPWLFPIAWDDVEIISDANISVPYVYDGAWSDPGTVTTLGPWNGYSVRNNENVSVTIVFHPQPPLETGKTIAETEEPEWRISLDARAGEARDHANYFGVTRNASPEWDNQDHVEPPPVGEYVSVTFPHRDWKQYPYDYTTDFRPDAATIEWDFAVRTNIENERITITIGGLETIPFQRTNRLIDTENGNEITGDMIVFTSGSDITERRYRFITSTSDSEDDDAVSVRPEKFVTARCYPNPFNPSTTLHYELSHQGTVRIGVFNSVGQMVKLFDVGYRNEGAHEMVIDTSDLTSGVYFYRVETGYGYASGKMMFMK